MKRPVICISTLFFIAIFASINFSRFSLFIKNHNKMIIIVSLIIIFTFIILKKAMIISVAFLGILTAILYLNAYNQQYVSPIQAFEDESIYITATVEDYPEIYEDTQRVKLKIDISSLGDEWTGNSSINSFTTKTYLPITTQSLIPGDIIKTTLSFYAPTVLDGFERQGYYMSEGYFILSSHNSDLENNPIEIISQKSISKYPLYLASKLKTLIHENLDLNHAGLTIAVMLGDKTYMSDELEFSLQKAGLAHVVATSGMHIGFLVSVLLVVFGYRNGSIISIIAILIFIPMAGFTPSIMRAGIMYITASFAFLIRQQYDGLNALFIALLILVFINPYAVNSVSLQLSFSSTLGIVLFCQKIQNKFIKPFKNFPVIAKKAFEYVIMSISCSISVLIFTIPILLYSFGYVSILSIITNLLAIFPISVIFVLGYFCSILLFFNIGIVGVFLKVLKLACDYIIYIANVISDLQYGIVFDDNFYGIILIILLYISIIFIIIIKKWKWYHFCCIFALDIAMMIMFVNGYNYEKNTLTVTVFPSGSGQCILVHSGMGEAILIDCGANGFRNAYESVNEYMKWHGLDNSLDALIFTSFDVTHARNAVELLGNISVDRVIISENFNEKEITESVLNFCNENNISITKWTNNNMQKLLYSPFGSVSVSAEIDKKLVVTIEKDDISILVAHGLTQNMLEEYLSIHEIEANTLILAEGKFDDVDKFKAALSVINPSQIIINSRYTRTDKIYDYEVHNTLLNGEFVFKTPKIKIGREGEKDGE